MSTIPSRPDVQAYMVLRGEENAHSIALKMSEEMGEVAECVLKDWPEKLAHEIADVVICGLILAEKYDIDVSQAVTEKWLILQSRRGRVKNGIFVKEEDQK